MYETFPYPSLFLLLLLLLLDERQHPHFNRTQAFSLILDDLLQLPQSLLDQCDLAVVEISRLFSCALHEETGAVLHEIDLFILHMEGGTLTRLLR